MLNVALSERCIHSANTDTTTCVTQEYWQAHKCTGYHHGILVIESLDKDTETRRLSPVALLADGYVDLNNGIEVLRSKKFP